MEVLKDAKINDEVVIKHESINDFFKKFLVNNNQRLDRYEENNLYYFFKDEIFIKKEVFGVKIFQKTFVFELEDKSIGSGKKLVNIYTYKIENYDDFSLKLVLTDFQIKPL